MVQGIVIPADAEKSVEQRDFTQFEDYQKAVGGWIEAVDLHDLGATVYVNEEGLLQHLPFNSRASLFWWYHVPGARQKAMLVGDAVLVGLPDRNGDSTDLPRDVRARLLTPARYRVELRLAGNSNWSRNPSVFPDYWEALIWGMVFLKRIPNMIDVRVLPVDSDGIGANEPSTAAV